jgi:hypothetical protein
VVRSDQKGEEAVAIGWTESPGYWIIRSHDAGRSWSAPLAVGDIPHGVAPAAELPMLAGDRLLLEIEILPRYEAGVEYPRAAHDHVIRRGCLEIPFAELERDRDGDGLTDLQEDRLLTDPELADTDGDGLGDAADPLPHVPFEPGVDRRSEVLAAVLAAIESRQRKGPVSIHFEEDGLTWVPPLPAEPWEKTSLVVADRSMFGPVRPPRRTVVLTRSELAAARDKLGEVYVLDLRLLLLDRTESQAVVIWIHSPVFGSGGDGGSFRMTRRDGRWIVDPASSIYWIS